MSKKYTMHVISGTHWDREWRYTAEQSRLRLMDLLDNTLNLLESKPNFKSFCIDGGMIVIEDYLIARPENKERVKKLVKQGKWQLMNWYTLHDMNTGSVECSFEDFPNMLNDSDDQ